MVSTASNSHESGDGVAASGPGKAGVADVAVQHFRSRDVDETQAYLSQLGHHTRVPSGRDAFAYEIAGAATRALTAVRINVAGRHAMRAADSAPMLFLPLRASQTFKIGRKAWQPNPSSAIFVASDHEYSAHAPAGAFLGLRVDGELLRREISGRLMGRSQALMLQSVEIPIDAGRLAALQAIHERMFTAAKSLHPWGAYGNVEAFEADAASWVAGLVMEQAGVRAASPESLQRVERIEQWVAAHLGENITLDRLCAVSGLGTRTLQKLFLARYGQSPLEWVNARRLAAARAQLLQAPAAVAISTVALDSGFTHLGRFSGAYRQAHGELPSATLAAARSRQGRQDSSPARPASRIIGTQSGYRERTGSVQIGANSIGLSPITPTLVAPRRPSHPHRRRGVTMRRG